MHKKEKNVANKGEFLKTYILRIIIFGEKQKEGYYY
jgi:hypothetical protein